MNDSQYDELNQFIEEYEEDSKSIRSERIVMKYYPKVFTMCAASLFERNIKNRCKNFITSPKKPLNINYTKIYRMNPPAAYKMYSKFKTENLNFSADEFYGLFNGEQFKIRVETIFEEIKQVKINEIDEHKKHLTPLLDKHERYENMFAKMCDLHDQYLRCSFEHAENAFLELKHRRNKVAHNYISGLSDTFVDIQNFYYKAVIYVIALEKAIEELTNI